MKQYRMGGRQTIGDSSSHKRDGFWGEGVCGEGGWVMDTGESMCYGECCEVCKPDDSQTYNPEANNIC